MYHCISISHTKAVNLKIGVKAQKYTIGNILVREIIDTFNQYIKFNVDEMNARDGIKYDLITNLFKDYHVA